MKRLVFALAAMTTMASCSQNEIVNQGGDSNAIKFSTVVGNSTKGNTFGVLSLTALKNSTDGFVVSTSGLGLGGEMTNLGVKYDGSKWNYTDDYYWPINAAQSVSFTAYAPAATSGVTLSPTTGVTVTGFVPAATADKQIDLLYAAPSNFNRTGSGASGVALTFNHLLTQVVFAVTSDIPSGENPKIVSIVVTIPKGTGAYDPTTSAWTVSGGQQIYTVFNNNALSKDDPVLSMPLLMIPQTLVAGTTATVNFSVNGVTSSNVIDLSKLNTVKTWAKSTKVTYSIAFNNADLKIKFADPTVSSWTNAADGLLY